MKDLTKALFDLNQLTDDQIPNVKVYGSDIHLTAKVGNLTMSPDCGNAIPYGNATSSEEEDGEAVEDIRDWNDMQHDLED